jgi:hypothetical protein
MEVLDIGNDHVLGFVRFNGTKRVIVLANFTEAEQSLSKQILRIYGIGDSLSNLLKGDRFHLADLILDPYEITLLETY